MTITTPGKIPANCYLCKRTAVSHFYRGDPIYEAINQPDKERISLCFDCIKAVETRADGPAFIDRTVRASEMAEHREPTTPGPLSAVASILGIRP